MAINRGSDEFCGRVVLCNLKSDVTVENIKKNEYKASISK